MNNISILLVVLIIASTPWIIKRPFMGLLMVIVINPFEGLFPLPAGLSLGRIAGLITVGSWMRLVSVDVETYQRWTRSRIKTWIWAFPLACLCGAILNFESGADVSALVKPSSVFLLVFMALMVESQITDYDRFSKLMMAVVVSSLILSLFPLAYHFGYDLYSFVGYKVEDSFGGSDRVTGLKDNSNGLGLACSFGVFAIVTAVSGSPKPVSSAIYVACGLIMFGGLILSGSRTHLIAVFTCIGTFCFLRVFGPSRGRWYALTGAIIIALSFPLTLSIAPEKVQQRFVMFGSGVEKSTYNRLNFTGIQRKEAFEMLYDNPVFGVGLANFKNVSKGKYGAHDSVSALVGETGVVGIVTFLLIAITSAYRLLQIIVWPHRSSHLSAYGYAVGLLAGLLAAGLAGFGGYIIFYQRWFWIVVGLSGALHENLSQNLTNEQ